LVVANLTRIEEGLEVRGLDGVRLGTVEQIRVDCACGDPGEVTAVGYIRIALDRAEDLEVKELCAPFSAITACIPGDHLSLDFAYRTEGTCYRALDWPVEW
jgi:hypothetical protein